METTRRHDLLLLFAIILGGGVAYAATSRAQGDPSSGTATDRDAPSRRDVVAMLSSFRDEPSVRQVQRAALEHAGLEADTPKSWASRARLANLVPEIEGEIAWLDEQDTQRQWREEIAAEAEALHRESAENRHDYDDRFRRGYSIEAELDLGGLVFDPDEVSAARELRQQQAARRELIAIVTELYFERRKKQILRLAGERSWRNRLDLVLAIEKLTARLDGLTGGWFRRRLDSNATQF